MSDLIRREAVLLTLKIFDYDIIPSVLARQYVREMLDTLYVKLNELPSAEPERKKGKWEVQPSTGDDRPFIWWKCSECGHVIFSETERDRKEFHAFCGRCGAEMTR